ncbi:MBL fold metallo-hydrolase [Ornithinimicrobium avium]|uniref:MBL fold metallo-hydrolase n=1 Tax=Ornithinimicrobium avium TaxID=2283195 RepID=A0A345NPK5_9MICO|nr:MBL fold metallo-hydrolase [Ornithinimicrobium avium]AXH96963.1 MBL fold metallo-hydrolase [Ornithinimicrobium avium]
MSHDRVLHLSPDSHMTVLGCASNSASGPTTSFVVYANEKGLLIDTGVDPIGRLTYNREDVAQVSSVIVTHSHSDHCAGFANFVFTRQLLAKNCDGIPPLQVYANRQTLNALDSQLKTQYPNREFDVIENEVIAGEAMRTPEGFTLVFLDSAHEVPAVSARITHDLHDWTIGIQSDSAPSNRFLKFFEGATVLVAEVHSLETDSGRLRRVHERGHSGLADAARLVEMVQPEVAIPFHLPSEFFSSAAAAATVAAALGEAGRRGLQCLPTIGQCTD